MMMLTYVINVLRGKVPVREELFLLETHLKEYVDNKFAELENKPQRFDAHRQLVDSLQQVEAKLDIYEKQIQQLKDENLRLAHLVGEIKKQLVSNKCEVKEGYSESPLVKQKVDINISNNITAERKMYFSQCSQMGFSTSYQLFGVDESFGSAYYVVVDNGTNDCPFYPIVNKSDSLQMNASSLLFPVCDLRADNSGVLKVIEKGEVHQSDNLWSVVRKCKISY